MFSALEAVFSLTMLIDNTAPKATSERLMFSTVEQVLANRARNLNTSWDKEGNQY